MLKQPLRPPPRRPREAKRGQVPCRARRHPDLRSGFAVARDQRLSLLTAWLLVSSDRLNGPSNRRFPLTKRAPHDAASFWGACPSPCDKLRFRLAAAQRRRGLGVLPIMRLGPI